MKRMRVVVSLCAAAAAAYLGSFTLAVESAGGPTEAPAAFDNQTNGLISQADFDDARAEFDSSWTVRA